MTTPTPQQQADELAATLFGSFAEFLDAQRRNALQDMANASGREDYGTAAKAQGVMQAMAVLSISMKNLALYPTMREAFLICYAPQSMKQ
jgi:hypothetical protein